MSRKLNGRERVTSKATSAPDTYILRIFDGLRMADFLTNMGVNPQHFGYDMARFQLIVSRL